MKDSARYAKIVEWSDEDQCYVGSSPGLIYGGCHGADLKGLGPVPGIAGRSPSYIARQLFDMQQGARKGQWSELMKATVSKLTEEDLVNISAYAASLAP